jgi:hypothetical protein
VSDAQVLTVEWDGIVIEVSYKPRDIMAMAHLELRVQYPKGAQLPVTETGYRSHFLHPGIVEEAGGPEAFVSAWLDHEADKPEWVQRVEKARQLDLFN